MLDPLIAQSSRMFSYIIDHHSIASCDASRTEVKHNYFAHNSATSTNDSLAPSLLLQNKTKKTHTARARCGFDTAALVNDYASVVYKTQSYILGTHTDAVRLTPP